ncbi:hypothetical protein DFH09DRAFT_1352328 [Mycena vulgaris]|nr:hypothetical protein DFH09DRAFT_1352328 [Mycena vulgaris]
MLRCTPIIFTPGVDHDHHNAMRTTNWWAVIVGIAPGIYANFLEVEKQTHSISEMKWEKFPTKAKALDYWNFWCDELHHHEDANAKEPRVKEQYCVVSIEGMFESYEVTPGAALELICLV